MSNIKIGDVVEIHTSRGLAYAQYTHEHEQYGSLIRVFKGVYGVRPQNLEELIQYEPLFICFFPLSAALRRKIVFIVGNFSIHLQSRSFPIFRTGIAGLETGKVSIWWLWDGEKEWKVGQLSAEQRKLPIRGIVNDTMLIHLIESEWTSEFDSR